MFKFTAFRATDVVDNTTRMLIVSRNNRYLVYSATRRRYVSSGASAVFRGDFAEPAELITRDNLFLWTSNSYKPVDGSVTEMSYVEAVAWTQDRYDMHQGMRELLIPRSYYDGMSRTARNDYARRVERAVNILVAKLDPSNSNTAEHMSHAVFKGSHYYNVYKFAAARNHFREFGHLLAKYKAGGDVDIHEVRDAFMELDDKYHDSTEPISNAFEAAEAAGNSKNDDLDVRYCDCGHYENSDDTHTVRNDTWCQACFDEDAVFVEDEDEYWPRDDAYYSESRDAYYSYDRDYDDRQDEDDDDDDRAIMSYSTNVLNVLGNESSIKSSHFGEFTMGIELEMTSGDADSDSAALSVRSRLGTSYCIIKHDGSLPHNGFEVVTSPHGLSTHIEKFKAWDIDPTYRAWNTGKCGMHIHIDSRAFTQLTLGKFLMFINSSGNVDFIRKIAGRHPAVDDQARSYCAAEHQSILVNPKQAVKNKSGERYRMVNMMNLGSREALRLGLSLDNSYNGKYNTVELRIFRASLKKERLLAQIEFTHASVMFCRVASWRDLNGASFIKWLKTVAGQYPALVKWYGVRAVHTSTPTVIAPAEVTCTDAVPPVVVSSDTVRRHDHDYPYSITYDSEAEHIRTWARRNDLFFRFARYSGAEYAFFPYGSSDTISAGDVVYERCLDQWVLMSESYAATLAQCSYVLAENQPV